MPRINKAIPLHERKNFLIGISATVSNVIGVDSVTITNAVNRAKSGDMTCRLKWKKRPSSTHPHHWEHYLGFEYCEYGQPQPIRLGDDAPYYFTTTRVYDAELLSDSRQWVMLRDVFEYMAKKLKGK